MNTLKALKRLRFRLWKAPKPISSVSKPSTVREICAHSANYVAGSHQNALETIHLISEVAFSTPQTHKNYTDQDRFEAARALNTLLGALSSHGMNLYTNAEKVKLSIALHREMKNGGNAMATKQ